jgi:hypothetical protein
MIGSPTLGAWGWPWHGIIQGGQIEYASGQYKAHAQPPHCSSWLIDMGLPAISLDTDQQADTTARGWEWRNYALLAGGYCYGTYLGDNTYIHVDAANVPWLVTLTDGAAQLPLWASGQSYLVDDMRRVAGVGYRCVTAHISDVFSADLAAGYWVAADATVAAQIRRFGLFGDGIQPAITRFMPVDCAEIGLSNPVGVYASRSIELMDVWTNGSKALIGVMLITSATPPLHDLFSVIEVSITGTGGSDGAGLSILATEIIGQPDLTTGTTGSFGGHYDPILSGVTFAYQYVQTAFIGCDGGPDSVGSIFGYVPGGGETEIRWRVDQDFAGGYPVMQGRWVGWRYARTAYYDQAGVAQPLIMEAREYEDHWITGTSGPVVSGVDLFYCNGSQDRTARVDWTVDIAGIWEFAVRILRGSTLVDEIATFQGFIGHQDHWTSPTNSNVSSTYNNTGPVAWRGTLAPMIPDSPTGFNSTAAVDNLRNGWRAANPHMAAAEVTYATTTIGMQRIDAKAAGFYVLSGGNRTYGTITTPIGNQTLAAPAAGNIFFAWQRKTGAIHLGTVPAVYV